MNFEETVTFLTQQWGTKTLSALRKQSLLESNGTSFDSLRTSNGQRLIIILCLTKSEQMSILEKVMDLSEDVPPADWDKLTLAELAVRTLQADGLSYEDLHDPSGKRISITLCATTPEMVGLLERIFKF